MLVVPRALLLNTAEIDASSVHTLRHHYLRLLRELDLAGSLRVDGRRWVELRHSQVFELLVDVATPVERSIRAVHPRLVRLGG